MTLIPSERDTMVVTTTYMFETIATPPSWLDLQFHLIRVLGGIGMEGVAKGSNHTVEKCHVDASIAHSRFHLVLVRKAQNPGTTDNTLL